MRYFKDETIEKSENEREAYLIELEEMLKDDSTELETLDFIWVLLKKIRGEKFSYEQ